LFNEAASAIQIGLDGVGQAVPTSWILKGPDALAGTATNINGANLTIAGGRNTGTGTGGSLLFQTAPAGSTGTAAGTLTTRLTIDSTGLSTFAGSVAVGGGTAITKVISATGTLDFPNTLAQTDSDLTITVTGAGDGDVVAVGIPSGSALAGSCYSAWVSATNTVTVRFSVYGLAAKDPASGSFRVSVTKF
jgi:hypothetical protein